MQHKPSTSVVIYDPVLADKEQLALAGLLAGYRGATRDAYALDLRRFVTWRRAHHLALLLVRRADIESYAPTMEELGDGTSICRPYPFPGSGQSPAGNRLWPSFVGRECTEFRRLLPLVE